MEPINDKLLISIGILLLLYIPVTMSLFKEIRHNRREGIIFDAIVLAYITGNLIYFICIWE